MPPKDKKKQIKDVKQAEPILLEYLKRQNRPYNANDLYANLHEAISKTVVVKALASMGEANIIREKLYGKQKIYFALQTDFDKLSPEEVAALDKELEELKKQHAALSTSCSQVEGELSRLRAQPLTSDAEKQLATIVAENERKASKLQGLKEDGKQMSEADRERINNKYRKYLQVWKRRKRTAGEVLDQILEGYNKPKKALYESAGIETDEEVKVDIRTFETV
eukprot:m.180724 g.180724  ORF g.180724 m.180724 type:complete len:223 (-) comp16862_c0_seq3:2588-3256(-)